VVATLTEANSQLAKHLEDHSNELKDIKALLRIEKSRNKGEENFQPFPR
jgi:ribosomal protein S15P/S13E